MLLRALLIRVFFETLLVLEEMGLGGNWYYFLGINENWNIV